MKKRTLFVLILTFLFSPCFADQYLLIMSKNDCVCQHMLKIYNEDLRKYGEIKYDQHEEFKAIKWEEKKSYTTYHGEKRYFDSPQDTALISQFDINGDGTDEFVVKTKTFYRFMLSDGLYYFAGEDVNHFRDSEFYLSLLRKATARLGGGPPHFYDLKELPQHLYSFGGKEAKAYYSLGGYVHIHPFFFGGSYYLAIDDEVPENGNIYSSGFLVILKYSKDNQPKDTCYFLKPDCRKGGN